MPKPEQIFITSGPLNDKDYVAGFDVQSNFERFSQKNEVFSRSFWDASIRSAKTERFYETYRKPLKKWKRAEGFTQKDYALRNASWHVTDIFAEMKEEEDRREGFLNTFSLQREGPTEQVKVESPEAMTVELKHIAKTFGADLVGITAYDERWVYTHQYSAQTQEAKPNDLPNNLPHVIVIGQAMDYDLIRTVPSALSGVATGLGYSHDALVLLSITQYIRNLGYRAVASMNDSALAIPYAIQAGLGEYGRNGLVITPQFGPRVRFGKIFTDLPLTHDQPIQFGVKPFCDICQYCADSCPVSAIPSGEPTDKVCNQSNIIGVKKWSVNGEACFSFWANQNSDCSICIRVCPYNKDFSQWIYRLGRKLAGTRLRKWMLKLDVWLGYGRRLKPSIWWQGTKN